MTIYFIILFYIFSIVFTYTLSLKRSLLRNCSKSNTCVCELFWSQRYNK